MEAKDLVVKLQAERLKELLKWRFYASLLASAVGEVLAGKAEVYVFGSAVEDRLTVDSDVDILIVIDELPRSGLKRAELIDRVWRAAEEKGVPWWYPFEIHLVTREELEAFKRSGAKIVPLKV